MQGALQASHRPWEAVTHPSTAVEPGLPISLSLWFSFLYSFSQILTKRPEAHLREAQKEGWGLRSPLSRFAFAQVPEQTLNW